MDIRKLALQNSRTTVENLEHQVKLHSVPAAPAGDDGGIVLHGLPADDGAPHPPDLGIQLAALNLTEEEQFLNDRKNVDPDALGIDDSIRLYSIIFATFRPGPAFRTGHDFIAQAFSAIASPKAQSWEDFLNGLNPTVGGVTWSQRIAAIARQCVRLDQTNAQQTQSGSGFLLPDGRLLTARHVILHPGWLFGSQIPKNPFHVPAILPGQALYNRVHPAGPAATPPPDANVFSRDCRFPSNPDLDFAVLEQDPNWKHIAQTALPQSEFGAAAAPAALSGLELQTTPLSDDYLKGLPVAVIGHPLSGNAGGTNSDIPLVYGDASLGTKRFMPGFLDFTNPWDDSRLKLKHDCSTLGGASGSCLIDLTTGKVLGIHVSGSVQLHNFVVPMWKICEALGLN